VWIDLPAATPDGESFVCRDRFSLVNQSLLLLRWRAGQAPSVAWTAKDVPLTRRTRRAPRPRAIRVSPDGETFVTLDGGPDAWMVSPLIRVSLWSVKDGTFLRSAKLPGGTLPLVAFAPDGERFVTCRTNALTIWDAATLTPARRDVRSDNRSRLTGLAFHPGGKYLAVTSNDRTVKLYDTTTWELARSYTWDIGKMRGVAFSKDGTLAAAGSSEGKIVVWDFDA
jgi:WD40 repeat protein